MWQKFTLEAHIPENFSHSWKIILSCEWHLVKDKNKIGDLFAASTLRARGKLTANKLFAASDHNLFAGFSVIATHSQLNHSLQKLIKCVKVLSCDWAVNKILFIPHSQGIILHRSTFVGWSQPCDHYSLLICRSKLITFWKYSIHSLIAAQSQLICTLCHETFWDYSAKSWFAACLPLNMFGL